MSRLLFLSHRIPYPPNKGEKIRPYHILKHFSARHRVYLGCLVDDPADWAHAATVGRMCADAHFARIDPRLAKLSYVRGLLAGDPLSVAHFRHRGLQHWVDEVIERVRPEIVFVFSGNMMPYVLDHAGRVRCLIADLADVDSEKWRAYADKASGPMRWLYRRETRLVAELERQAATAADWCTFVSEAEAELFRRLVPEHARRARGISNGIDTVHFDPALPFPIPFAKERPTYVFTGTMDYPPNVDAVCWFADEVLPMIRRRVPQAQFAIVGASPAPAVARLAARPEVLVTGRVADVRPYLAHAVAAVAPLRIARGIQNKVLEGMAMARPVILTPEALEGIDAEPGREVVLCRDAGELADAAVRLADDRAEGTAIGAAARAKVVERYAWDALLPAFDGLIAAALGAGAPAPPLPRAAGF